MPSLQHHLCCTSDPAPLALPIRFCGRPLCSHALCACCLGCFDSFDVCDLYCLLCCLHCALGGCPCVQGQSLSLPRLALLLRGPGRHLPLSDSTIRVSVAPLPSNSVNLLLSTAFPPPSLLLALLLSPDPASTVASGTQTPCVWPLTVPPVKK